MIDLRQLRQFIAVAEELHFHRAAARLNMSQPPLTAAVRKLEKEIGAHLLERGNKTVRLTAAGAVFLEEAKRTVAQADRAVLVAREAAAGRTGTVRLCYVGSSLYGRLPRLISQFRQEAPGVRLELREATSAQQIRMLREDRADVGVVVMPVPDIADMSLAVFDTDRLAIALPRRHRLAGKKVRLEALSDEPFVLWPAPEGKGFHMRAIRLCAEAGFVPTIVQEAHGMHAVLSLVAIGAGVSLVPSNMSSFRRDEVVYHPVASKEAVFELGLCFRDESQPPSVKRFIALARSLPR